MITFLVFFLVLSILVLVHELGHFLMAKKAGIFVEEFGFGLPPRAIGIKVGETIYSLNWLPFGGFVKLFGEEGEIRDVPGRGGSASEQSTKDIPKSRAFYAKHWLVKSGVVIAGVVMNIVLAVTVFAIAYSVTGIPEETDRIEVMEVAPGSPAEVGGLQVGDKLVGINAYFPGVKLLEIHNVKQFSDFVEQNKGSQLLVSLERKDQIISVTMTPRANPPEGQGPTGVAISPVIKEVFYPWWQMPFRGVWEGMKEAYGWTMLVATMLGSMVWQLVAVGKAPEGVSGPFGIYQATGEVIKFGVIPTMRFLGILSVNLAVLNILPIPALDGGRLAFIVCEGLTGKKVKARVEQYIHTVGMALLIFLLIVVTFNDLWRAFGGAWWVLEAKRLWGM